MRAALSGLTRLVLLASCRVSDHQAKMLPTAGKQETDRVRHFHGEGKRSQTASLAVVRLDCYYRNTATRRDRELWR